jgi:hypothetical protein
MEHSPSCEAKNFSASQEIPWNLLTPKVHYIADKSPELVPILNQINSRPFIPLLKNKLILPIHLHLCLPSVLFPLGFPIRILQALNYSSLRAVYYAYLILVEFIILITLAEVLINFNCLFYIINKVTGSRR